MAHPGNTLHRTNRPKPKLRPRQAKAEVPRKVLRQVRLAHHCTEPVQPLLHSVNDIICELQVTRATSRRRPQPSNALQQIPLEDVQGNADHENLQRSFSAPARDNTELEKPSSPADNFAGCAHSPNRRPCHVKKRAQNGSIARSHSASALRSKRGASRAPMTRLQHAIDDLTADPTLLESAHGAEDIARGEIPCSFPLDATAHAVAMRTCTQVGVGPSVRPSRPFKTSSAPQGRLHGACMSGAEGPVPSNGPRTRSQTRHQWQTQECQQHGLLVAERSAHAHAGPCMPVSLPCGVNTRGLHCEDEVPVSMDVDSGCPASCSTLYRNSNSGSTKKQRTPVQKKLMIVRKRTAGRGKASSHTLVMRMGQDEVIEASRHGA